MSSWNGMFLWWYTIGKGVFFQFQTHAVTDLFSPRITQLSKSMWEWNLPHGVVPIECYYLSPISFHFFLTIYMNSIILRSLISICFRGRVQSNSKPVHILNTIFIIAFNGFFLFKESQKETNNKQTKPKHLFFMKEIGSWLIDTSPVLSFWWQKREKSLFIVYIVYVDTFFYPYVRGCDKARIRSNI